MAEQPTGVPNTQRRFPRCALCSAFREKDVTHVVCENRLKELLLLNALCVPSPCLRLMPYCKDEPRLR
jgi:hypothetical protein